jgi:manganese/zinc/iron transport system ATP- binding protein
MIRQTDEPILEVHDLTVRYDHKPVLWSVDFSLPKGIVAGIMGPNGAGKSTLLKSMMGLLEPSSGHISFFGQPLEKVRKKVSYVPQRESISWDFPITVEDVVMMGRYPHLGLWKKAQKADHALVQSCLARVGMEAYAHRQIAQLSGGQQQRVFLARALCQEAELYVLDEPFTGVDAATEKTVIALLQQMAQEGKTVIVVHHDLQTAPQYFDWLVLLNLHLVSSAPIVEAYTAENIQKAYGGHLTILSEVGQRLAEKGFPQREKK